MKSKLTILISAILSIIGLITDTAPILGLSILLFIFGLIMIPVEPKKHKSIHEACEDINDLKK